MKNRLLVSLILGALPLTMMAQDDDMYFVPTKKNVAKEAASYGVPRTTYYSGSNRSVDEYNRRGGSSYYQVLPGDTTGMGQNDIISFNGEVGVYPDSAQAEDFALTRQMARYDGYEPDVAYREGYRDGRRDSWGWHSPWFYSSYYPWYDSYWYWNDPWYYGHYGYYGWYDPWYDPWYYGYGWHRPYGWYGGYYGYYHPYYYGGGGGYVSRPLRRDSGRASFGVSGRSTFGNSRGTAANAHSRSGFGASRSRTASTVSRSSNSSFGASQSSTGGFGASRSSSSSAGSSFGGSTRSSGSSGGSFGASGGSSRSSSGGGGGFGRHR
ncbi:MAG: hypothetical protein IJ551_08405 [Prevotella sp.]|nr:hypothetical protein [Prevotella sp.]